MKNKLKNEFKNYIKQFVYGATDGVVTTFAIIAGSVGARLSPSIVLILGISNVLADGFSMAASNYLSERSEHQNEKGSVRTSFFSGVATFISFVLVGFIPVLPFIFGKVLDLSYDNQFLVAVLATSLAFIFIGVMRGLVTKRSLLGSALETLSIGIIAAFIAYFVGGFVDSLI